MFKKKILINLVLAVFLLNIGLIPAKTHAVLSYPTVKLTVAEGWMHGMDEQWHLIPVNEKSVYAVHEKVQFFAQVGPITGCHQWRLVLYKNGEHYREITNNLFALATGETWNYSNFVPYMNDLNSGSYRAEYLLDVGYGFQNLGDVSFTVSDPAFAYHYLDAQTAYGWEHGTDDYWNLSPIDPTSTFSAGDKIYVLAKAKDVYVNHQWKVELYRKGTSDIMLWDYSSAWNEVGSGWNYSNFYPYYENAVSGNYAFKIYLNSGNGFTLMDTVDFTVSGEIKDYVYLDAQTAHGWEHGTDDYWNLSPIDPTSTFSAGDKIYVLAKAKDVYVNHQWKVELYRKGTSDIMLWDYSSAWNEVGSGWNYSNFYPYYERAVPGNYAFKIYLNSGNGFTLLDTVDFTVSGEIKDYVYYGATVAESWTYGSGLEYWNIQAVNPRTEFNQGETVYLVAQARDVYIKHRWKVETYRNGMIVWSSETPWNEVGSGWAYSNYYPSNTNSQAGSYEFKLYFDDGDGFELLDTKSFTVNPTVCTSSSLNCME